MSIFGSYYPPGAANDPSAPYNQEEPPCLICGLFIDVPRDPCSCPECPECGSIGDPKCYELHGMTRTPEQIASLAKQEAKWAADCAAEAEYWAAYDPSKEEW